MITKWNKVKFTILNTLGALSNLWYAAWVLLIGTAWWMLYFKLLFEAKQW